MGGAAFCAGAVTKSSPVARLLGSDTGSNILRSLILPTNTSSVFAHFLYFNSVPYSYVLGSSVKQIVSEDKEVFNLESRTAIENSLKQVTVLHACALRAGAPPRVPRPRPPPARCLFIGSRVRTVVCGDKLQIKLKLYQEENKAAVSCQSQSAMHSKTTKLAETHLCIP